VPGLVIVDPADPLDVIDQDGAEAAIGSLSVPNHRLKSLARVRPDAAYCVIGVRPQDREIMGIGVGPEGDQLIFERSLLSICGATEVCDGAGLRVVLIWHAAPACHRAPDEGDSAHTS
jgi:hypothetical protein